MFYMLLAFCTCEIKIFFTFKIFECIGEGFYMARVMMTILLYIFTSITKFDKF